MAGDQDDETFFKDLGLAIVTLGFYMPYWMWRKNEDLRDYLPKEQYANNGWWLSGGAAIAFAASWLLGSFTGSRPRALDRVPEALFATLGIVVFLYGVFLFTLHLQQASRLLKVKSSDTPWLFPATMAAAFVGMQLGNVITSWWLRGPVLVAYFSLPYFFYRAHRDFTRVENEALKRLTRQREEAVVPKRPRPVEEAPPTWTRHRTG